MKTTQTRKPALTLLATAAAALMTAGAAQTLARAYRVSPGRRVLVVFSDGDDRSSHATINAVEKAVRANDATLIGGQTKVPAHNAALCNGILAHGQDYDDTHTESVVHPSAALVPVALAVAEQSGCSGRDMLTALVAELGSLDGKLLISIAAGIRVARLQEMAGGHDRIIRTMPNTPAMVGRGITGICGNAHAGAAGLHRADMRFGRNAAGLL